MYAIVKTGGKQYKVREGDVLRVEKLTVAEGADLELDQVLLVADGEKINVGTPYLPGSKVSATVKSHGRGEKIRIVKHQRRKHFHKEMGHRQYYTELQITGISTGA